MHLPEVGLRLSENDHKTYLLDHAFTTISFDIRRRQVTPLDTFRQLPTVLVLDYQQVVSPEAQR